MNLSDYLPLGDCFLCQRSMQPMICLACQSTLPWLKKPCELCASPLPDNESSTQCGRCLDSPPCWDRLIAPWRYEATIQKLIHQIKFYKTPHLAAELGTLLGQHIAKIKDIPTVDCLIPVPLHRTRLARRSYNQAEWIARACGKVLGIPVNTTLLIRHSRTKAQAKLKSAESRSKNIQNAFKLKNCPDYQHIAIIDDVYTTGSTLRACLASWDKKSPTRFSAWCLAKS